MSAFLYAVIAVLVPGLAVLLVPVVAAEIVAVISLPGTRTAVTRRRSGTTPVRLIRPRGDSRASATVGDLDPVGEPRQPTA